MASSTLNGIEKQIEQLSREDQLRLLEHLSSRLRNDAVAKRASREAELAEMAADPQIQKELRELE